MNMTSSVGMESRSRRPSAFLILGGLFALLMAVPGAAVADGQRTWNAFLGSAGWDTGRAVAADRSGNVFVAGITDSSWGSPVRAYTARNDAFVAKLDASGKVVWTTFLGGTGTDNVYGIALDPNGGVYVAGTSDVSWGRPVAPFQAGFDAFMAKLDGSGKLVWNTFLGGSGTDQANGVAADADGNAYVVGSSTDGWGTPEGDYWAGSDAFAARLDADGRLLWNAFLAGNGDDYGRGIALDAAGNSYYVGMSTDTWGVPIRGYSYSSDAWAAELDSNGHIYWNTFLGGEGYDNGNGIAVDASGNAYVTGSSNTTWGDPLSDLVGGYDAFAVKLDTTGAIAWSTFVGGDGKNFGISVAVDENGYVTLAGYGLGSITAPSDPLAEPAGKYDVFLAKLDADGNYDWHAFVGGTGDDFLEGMVLDPDRNIVLIGVSDAGWGSPVRAFTANYDAFAAVVPETPAAAEIVSVSAAPREDRIELSWETASEPALAGFNVWRREAGSEGFHRISDALIPGQGGPASGSTYIYTDAGVVPGASYSYEIEIVDRRARSAFEGPVDAVASAIRLIGPPQGAVIRLGTPLRFGWEARGPVAFKVELSNQADFKTVRLALPKDEWIEAKSYVLSRAEMDLVRRLSSTGRVVYWRVLAKMPDGAVVVSNARWFGLRASR
jgi:hypothetical protein